MHPKCRLLRLRRLNRSRGIAGINREGGRVKRTAVVFRSFLRVLGGNVVQAHRLWQQPGGLFVYSRRHDPWRGNCATGLPGTQGRLAVSAVRKRGCGRDCDDLYSGSERGQRVGEIKVMETKTHKRENYELISTVTPHKSTCARHCDPQSCAVAGFRADQFGT